MKSIIIYNQYAQQKATYEDVKHIHLSGIHLDGKRTIIIILNSNIEMVLELDPSDFIGVW